MTSPSPAGRSTGLALATAGGLFLSFDIPLVRLSDGGLWPVLGLRSMAIFLIALLALAGIRLATGRWSALPLTAATLVGGLFYGFSTMAFVAAVYHTSSANVVFIVAFSPMIAAILSWLFLKEPPSRSTLVTMVVMLLGVSLIVNGGVSSGHLFGDFLAAVAAVLIAAALTIGRASRQAMGFVPLLATIIPAGFSLVLGWSYGFTMQAPGWALLDGIVMMPLAFWLLATAPRYLPAAEVGMFYLLETILAPVWIWMIFSEMPGTPTLIGGGIMVLALLGHSLTQIWAGRLAARRAQTSITASTGLLGE